MSSQEPIIVVTGGSVSVEFNSSLLQGSSGSFNNPNKVITRVEVTGDGIDFDESITNGSVTIKIYCDNA